MRACDATDTMYDCERITGNSRIVKGRKRYSRGGCSTRMGGRTVLKGPRRYTSYFNPFRNWGTTHHYVRPTYVSTPIVAHRTVTHVEPMSGAAVVTAISLVALVALAVVVLDTPTLGYCERQGCTFSHVEYGSDLFSSWSRDVCICPD